ncbi:hypothetical protein [Pseudomonas sp. EL_65y_Pfl2_R96]|uniref:hypothetical protein n=1 Tax=Pseudomonas sp. EL_65y_Pfl2_R96 TaxID=3088699 RepID=UPI0030DA8CBE
MFDITSDDINQLDDTDLRELVGRLCEAELVSRGLSAAAVTWGGNQTAPDGGLDVRVALPKGTSIDGFVPRFSTGFQVKKPDMPKAAILVEMRPAGVIRPVIQELADESGAYVIVSSTGSTADGALRNRQNALREALDGVDDAGQLHTDFYDRTRLATWVRQHPGLITWVKEKVGRALLGWRPYGPWSGATEGIDAEYLMDDKLRLHLDKHSDAPTQPIADSIDELRDMLAHPGKMVRLVGLSGVGKTRLVQVLFDSRIGSRPLSPSLAVYTNLSDNPTPQPTGLASDLIANRTRAILIVDNCPPDLHRRLSDLCSGHDSTVSVITVEYDVRDDQPEGTQVVTLETSSPELIEKLLQRRYPYLSQVNARTVAEASGGNARIAIALAETVERSDSIAGLSNDELFQRLFRQRQDPNDALLLAAQACSLVYSFQGEALVGEEAEIPRLASLAGQAPLETYRHVNELLRRDLVQQRSTWRAVLPHAIANRLAARALEDLPYDLINQHLIEGGTERLARSFSRRLSFLHDHPKALAIVKRWLDPDGLLGDVTALSDLGKEMFENVAPVLPEKALATLERVDNCQPDIAIATWQRHLSLLRSLAYDPVLFERSTKLLARAAMQSEDQQETKEASDTLTSLFTIYLSGTHATIEQRLSVVEKLLKSGEAKALELGLAALDKVLEVDNFSSSYQFEFGARSRDYGYRPQREVDIMSWYAAALSLIERLFLSEENLKPELRDLLARNFRGLCGLAPLQDDVERLFRIFSSERFWRAGWSACREIIQFDKDWLTPEASLRLSALEADLRPSGISDQVRAVVLGKSYDSFELEEIDVNSGLSRASERLDVSALQLGAAVAIDDSVFTELLPDLLRGGNRTWTFGRGLAGASPDLRATWERLVEGLQKTDLEHRDIQLLKGFLAEVWEHDRNLAQQLLDSALDQPVLITFLPELHSAVILDARGVERLKRALNERLVPVWMYQHLTLSRIDIHMASGVIKDLLCLIANQPDGFNVALELLFRLLHSDSSAQQKHVPELLEVGQELLQGIKFRKGNARDDFYLADLVRFCLKGPEGRLIAGEVALRLKKAIAARDVYAFDNDDLLKALLELQPVAVLDALLTGDEKDLRAGVSVFKYTGRNRANPVDSISCELLISWCEGDRDSRYPRAAAIITFARRPKANDPLIWSEQAKTLIAGAPAPESVIAVFIERFRPNPWSGSLAALIEANARLLDSLETDALPELKLFVTEAKAKLAQDIALARKWETEQDRAQDERFE